MPPRVGRSTCCYLIAIGWLLASTAGQTAEPPGCRWVTHAMGESCVPADPGRVVVLDTGELDVALTLGVRPIAAVVPAGTGRFPAYLARPVADLPIVGTIGAPSLERIALLRPDLIIGSRSRYAGIYDHLRRIAPTVLSESVGASWKANFRLFATALGRREAAERWLRKYRERTRRLRRSLQTGGPLPTVSIVRSFSGYVRLYLPATFIGSVLADVGLPRPPSQSGPGFAVRLRTPEVIERLDADVMFISFYGERQDSLLDQWMELRLWDQLTAVRRGQVYPVDDDVWMLGLGPTAASLVLDDLERYLGDAG